MQIHGLVYDTGLGRFERKTNKNRWYLNNKPNLRHFLVGKWLEWTRHVWRAESLLIKKVTENKLS